MGESLVWVAMRLGHQCDTDRDWKQQAWRERGVDEDCLITDPVYCIQHTQLVLSLPQFSSPLPPCGYVTMFFCRNLLHMAGRPTESIFFSSLFVEISCVCVCVQTGRARSHHKNKVWPQRPHKCLYAYRKAEEGKRQSHTQRLLLRHRGRDINNIGETSVCVSAPSRRPPGGAGVFNNNNNNERDDGHVIHHCGRGRWARGSPEAAGPSLSLLVYPGLGRIRQTHILATCVCVCVCAFRDCGREGEVTTVCVEFTRESRSPLVR